MSAEFKNIARDLSEKGFTIASKETRALASDLKNRGLIPDKLSSAGKQLPDFSYMKDLPDDEEVPTGTYQEQIRYYRKQRLGMGIEMFGEILGVSSSTAGRLEDPKYKSKFVLPTLLLIEKLKLGKKQAESLVKAAGFSPQVIELILSK